jgi:hypothetical protein
MEATNEKTPVSKKAANLSNLWVRILCYLAVLAILVVALFPTTTRNPLIGNLMAVSARGNDILRSITGANADRVPLGLPPVWPKTYLATTNHPGDVSSKIFKTSSDYFYELYDGPNVGTEKHDPYIKGFGYSKLAGAGVPAKSGSGKLDAQNNMWIIAANITDQDDDRIPFLITRNVDVKEIERVVNQGLKASEFKIGIDLGKGQYRVPFSNKGFAAVFKGGTTLKLKKRTVTLGELFGNKELPPRDPSKPPIVYLMP